MEGTLLVFRGLLKEKAALLRELRKTHVSLSGLEHLRGYDLFAAFENDSGRLWIDEVKDFILLWKEKLGQLNHTLNPELVTSLRTFGYLYKSGEPTSILTDYGQKLEQEQKKLQEILSFFHQLLLAYGQAGNSLPEATEEKLDAVYTLRNLLEINYRSLLKLYQLIYQQQKGIGKIAIISDIHSNLQAFEAVLADIKKQGIHKIYCLGDTVGYGGNPVECVELLRQEGIPSVQGNHEAYMAGEPLDDVSEKAKAIIQYQQKFILNEERYNLIDYFKDLPLTLTLNGVMLVHADPAEPKAWQYVGLALTEEEAIQANFPLEEVSSTNVHRRFKLLDAFKAMGELPLCFIGHSHVPFLIEKSEEDGVLFRLYHPSNISPEQFIFCPSPRRRHPIVYGKPIPVNVQHRSIINVGSVGQPRDEDTHARYVVYDRKASTITFRRVKYDIYDAQQAISKFYDNKEIIASLRKSKSETYEINTFLNYSHHMAKRLEVGR